MQPQRAAASTTSLPADRAHQHEPCRRKIKSREILRVAAAQMAVIATIRQLIVEGSKRYNQARATVLGHRTLALIATSAALGHLWCDERLCSDTRSLFGRRGAEAIETIVAPMFSALVEPVAQNA